MVFHLHRREFYWIRQIFSDYLSGNQHQCTYCEGTHVRAHGLGKQGNMSIVKNVNSQNHQRCQSQLCFNIPHISSDFKVLKYIKIFVDCSEYCVSRAGYSLKIDTKTPLVNQTIYSQTRSFNRGNQLCVKVVLKCIKIFLLKCNVS